AGSPTPSVRGGLVPRAPSRARPRRWCGDLRLPTADDVPWPPLRLGRRSPAGASRPERHGRRAGPPRAPAARRPLPRRVASSRARTDGLRLPTRSAMPRTRAGRERARPRCLVRPRTPTTRGARWLPGRRALVGFSEGTFFRRDPAFAELPDLTIDAH